MAVTRTERRRRSAVFVLVVVLTAVVGVLAALALVADLVVRERYDANIERFADPFAAIPDDTRPPAAAPGDDGADGGGARTYLLLGTDSRISGGDASQWEFGAQRTDAIMLAHLPADRTGLYVVSIPRDTWVDIPGHGEAKVNAAYSFGGPTLLVQTLEELTGVRIDHLAIVDFEGFVEMTDALGGVEVTVPEATGDMRAEFPAGTYTMDGEQALDYVRQRYGLARGDFDRVQRQQNWIRAVLQRALSRDTLTDPARLDAFARATTSSLALDQGFDMREMRSLAYSARGLRGDDLHFFTVPVEGTARSQDGQSIVVLDEDAADTLWAAMREDRLAEWLATADTDVLGDRVS